MMIRQSRRVQVNSRPDRPAASGLGRAGHRHDAPFVLFIVVEYLKAVDDCGIPVTYRGAGPAHSCCGTRAQSPHSAWPRSQAHDLACTRVGASAHRHKDALHDQRPQIRIRDARPAQLGRGDYSA